MIQIFSYELLGGNILGGVAGRDVHCMLSHVWMIITFLARRFCGGIIVKVVCLVA